jgi:hypothetical protein
MPQPPVLEVTVLNSFRLMLVPPVAIIPKRARLARIFAPIWRKRGTRRLLACLA